MNRDLYLACLHILLRYHGHLPAHEIDNESLKEVLGPSLRVTKRA